MNLTTEEVKTIYFDSDSIRLPDYRMRCVTVSGETGRMYYVPTVTETDINIDLFTSLTTVISQCSPTPWAIIEHFWAKYGIAEASRLLKMLAHYGSMWHQACGDYCFKQTFQFDKAKEYVENYLSKHEFWEPECKEWEWRLKQDMIAFAQFVYDTKMKCFAIELALCSYKYGFASRIDIAAKVMLPVKGFYGEVYKSGPRKDQPKETSELVEKTALINMKSGRHNFYTSNGLQLECEKILFEENFPDIKIDCIMNLAPKEWESIDGDKYAYKDWSGIINPVEVDCMLRLAESRYKDRMQEKERMSIWGEVLYGNSPVNNISKELLVDMIKRWEKKRLDPEVPYIKKVGGIELPEPPADA